MKRSERNKILFISISALAAVLLLCIFLVRGFLDSYKKEAQITAEAVQEETVKLPETEIKEEKIEDAKEEKSDQVKEEPKDNNKETIRKEDDEDFYRMLDFDRRYILNIGVQEDDLCSLFDLAYARAILDEKFDIDPYEYFDGEGADWRKAGFEDIALSDPLSVVLQRAYDQISAGKPVLFYVTDIYGHSAQNEESLRNAYAGHYVLLIGYEENADYEDLEPSDFYAADPSAGYCCEIDSYMPWIVLTDKAPAKTSGEYALYAPVSDKGIKTCLAYADECNWDADQSKAILPKYIETE
ncbi:MAG: C39 family peptidase [Erysipelotrichaceae bacterium]|nr:C39 family peptidase [Clostridia bacterium]MBQ6218085.1 C39 family peptidase [Erysipelotrichaceae bacterium]